MFVMVATATINITTPVLYGNFTWFKTQQEDHLSVMVPIHQTAIELLKYYLLCRRKHGTSNLFFSASCGWYLLSRGTL